MGHMALLGVGAVPVVVGGGDAAETTAFLARTTGLSGAETAAYKELINGLVADGVWTKLDALYIFATNTETTAQLNLVSTSFGLTKFGTVAFAVDVGYTGDGSTGALQTGLVPSAGGVNYTQNSASLGAYILSSRAGGFTYAAIGVQNIAEAVIYPKHPGGAFFDVNNGLTGFATAAPSTVQGQWITTRTASNALAVYLNGNTTAYGTGSVASTGVPAAAIAIFATALGPGSFDHRSADQLSAAFIGGGLSSAQMALIASRINGYMTALGVNVY